MKVIISFVILILFFPAMVFAGEANVTERFLFDSTFDEMVEAIKGHEDEVILGSMGAAEVIERNGDKLKVRVKTPIRTAEFTLQMKEDVDYRKKRSEFESHLVETDGFVTTQNTSVVSVEKNGKMLVTVKVNVVVPTVGDKLIQFEVRRSIQKMIRRINRLTE